MEEETSLNLYDFIQQLSQKNIRLSVADDNLHCVMAKGSSLLTHERDYIKKFKKQLIAYLKEIHQTPIIESIYPLSYLQQGMLFHYLQDPKSDQYLLQLGLRFNGLVYPELFKEAWEKVIEKYDILRVKFVWQDVQHPVQVVHHTVSLSWQEEDLSHLPEDLYEITWNQRIDEDRQQGMDLSKPCCMRFSLIKKSDLVYDFMWTKHHIIIDGWSSAKILQNVLQFYHQLVNGVNIAHVAQSSYQIFINWLQRVDEKKACTFWREYLGNMESPPALDFGNTSIGFIPSSNKIVKEFTIDKEISKKLGHFVKIQQITLNTLFQYAWGKLLSIYCNTNHVIFGVAFSGRSYAIPDIHNLVGLFVNTLPVRIQFKSNFIVKDALKLLHNSIRLIDEFSYIGLNKIKQLTDIPQDIPLFHTLFSFENYFVDRHCEERFLRRSNPDIPGSPRLNASQPCDDDFVGIYQKTYRSKTNFPLQIQITPSEHITIRLVADSELLSEVMIADLLNNYLGIINEIIENPDQEEQAIWPIKMHYQPLMPLSHETIGSLFLKQVQKTPNSLAIWDNDKTLTFSELNNRANYLAALIKSNYPENSHFSQTIIGICLDRSVDACIAILAIWKLGAAYLPLDPLAPEIRNKFIIEDANIHLIVCYEKYQAKLSRELLIFEEVNFNSTDRHCERSAAIQAISDTLPGLSRFARNDSSLTIAYVLYTSGSTGQPKGVKCYHHSIVNRFQWYWQAYPFDAHEKCCQKAALTFVDSIQEFFCPLLQGIPVGVISNKRMNNVADFIHFLIENQITRLELVPSLLRLILDNVDQQIKVLDKLHWWIVSGEELTGDLVERFRQAFPAGRLLNRFGSTEASTSLWFDTRHWQGGRKVPIGKPIANVNIYILNDEKKLVPQGVMGEMYIEGHGLAAGYLNQDILNQERFIHHPAIPNVVFRSGDLVRSLENGNIEYLGRRDLQIKINGIRIDLGEIEATLLNHPQIKEIVVLAREDAIHKLIAFVVFVNKALSKEALWHYAQGVLPHYMVPSIYIPMTSIPLTSHGKRDFVSLMSLPIDEHIIKYEYVPPQTEVECAIIDICQKILSIEKIGLQDNFFQLGGDSMGVIRLITQLKQRYGMDCTINQVFSAANFARLVEGMQNNQYFPNQKSVVKQTELPLSSAQSRIWFLEKMQEDYQPIFHITHAIELFDIVNPHCLEEALNKLIARQPSLRMAFKSRLGEPFAEIMPLRHYSLPIEIISEDILVETLNQARLEPFQLEEGYLLHIKLLQLSPEKFVLSCIFHHIIMDAWSTDIFLRELTHIYQSLIQNKMINLPSLTRNYADFSAAEEAYLKSMEVKASVSYWQEKLKDYQNINLPTDFSVPEISHVGKRFYFSLPQDCSSGLKHLARTESSTLYTVLLAITHVLLRSYTHQEDMVIGTPITNRHQLEFQNVIGLFLNLLPIRNESLPNQTFRQFLQMVKENCLGAFKHQLLPFEYLVEALSVRRDAFHTPIFQVLLVLHQNHLDLGTSFGKSIPLSDMSVKYDLVFSFSEKDDGVSGFIHYKTHLFKDETIEKMVEHLQGIINDIVLAPNKCIADINLLSYAEKVKLKTLGRGKTTDYLYHTLSELWMVTANRYANKTAVVVDGKSYTYQMLYQDTYRLAAHLQARLPHKPELLIAVNIPSCYEMIVSILGTLLAGFAYVPIDPAYPEKRIQQIIDDANATLLLTTENVRLLLQTPHHTEIKNNIAPHHLAYVLYTSGTTGRPKGVMIEHRSVLNHIQWLQDFADLQANYQVDCSSSFSFDFTVTTSVAALLTGATVYLCPESVKANPLHYLEYLHKQRINFIKLTPSYFSALCRQLEGDTLNLPDLQIILLGGEVLRPSDCKKWLQCYPKHVLINEYGPTETTVAVCAYHIKNDTLKDFSASVPIGFAGFNTTLQILSDNLQPKPPGLMGEIYIGGDCLARGYFNQPELTKKNFVEYRDEQNKIHRLYRTGDRGRFLENGALEYCGRQREQNKILGYRIDLNEIVSLLKEHHKIIDGLAIITESSHLVVYYLNDSPLIKEIANAFLADHVPAYMLPTYYIEVTAFPLTRHGKIDLNKLPPVLLKVEPERFVYPRTECEATIAEIWCELLQLDKISVNVNFFESGGHSLLALQLIARMNQSFSIEIKVSDLFRYPTIEGLAAAIDEQNLNPVRIVPLAWRKSDKRPLFIIPGSAGNPYSYLPLAKHIQNIPVYGVRHPGLTGNVEEELLTIEELAAHYLEGVFSIQAEGPYMLAGHSFGGLVAYQMACQLEEEGHAVSQLIIIDTAAPQYINTQGDKRDNVAWLMGIANVLMSYTGLHIDISAEILQSLPEEKRYEYYLEKLISAKVIPKTANSDLVKTMVKVYRTASLATKMYQPISANVPITLIKAKDNSKNQVIDVVDWGWGELVNQEVKVISASGNHITMITEPYVKELAGLII